MVVVVNPGLDRSGPVTEVVKEQITLSFVLASFERVIFVIQKLVVSKVQLQNRVRDLEELLCQARRDCDLKSKEYEQEQEAHIILQCKYHQTLFYKEKLLEEREQVREAHSILLAEKEEMIKTLTHKAELLKEREQMKKAYIILQAENNETLTHLEEENIEMKKTLLDQEELLRVTLAEAEENRQKYVETIAQLEKEKNEMKKTITQLEEKSDLTEKVETLRDTVEKLRNQLTETHLPVKTHR
ncbi:hypothetical protein QTP86_009006 [Hemibagrus guttatus]|nr:hypothetical protein QTP86_009006 [Hemibagrus guttatus]